jgi:hypothetical protein
MSRWKRLGWVRQLDETRPPEIRPQGESREFFSQAWFRASGELVPLRSFGEGESTGYVQVRTDEKSANRLVLNASGSQRLLAITMAQYDQLPIAAISHSPERLAPGDPEGC